MTSTSPWRALRSPRGLRNLAATATAVTASAALGGLATTPDSDWYAGLDKPAWQPPPIAFPLVWTPLYADIAATVRRGADHSSRVRAATTRWRTCAGRSR